MTSPASGGRQHLDGLQRPEPARSVAGATLDQVLAVADSLGYVPKADAVSKARQKMRRSGCSLPSVVTGRTSSAGRGAGGSAGRGMEVSAFDHESLATASSPVLASMPIRGQVDGIIVMGMRIEDVMSSVSSTGMSRRRRRC